jgi:cell division septum initiation protein DivIVA
MSEPTLEEMQKQIEGMEKELLEAKKAYRERRTSGLRDAMEAKKLADEAVKEEMKALGYRSSYSSLEWSPFTGWKL